ncbi:hypothetical protein [Roseateles amylovorans]|uniref:Uncharacterized protein n=1 Tax=Roseateles amylovorans TaxID=2978473 RepID=A0ABY6B0B1_9BURK|nr:hypothetical protein [Roseateles amylovorans]UXH78608.1 hypothetical protein N4261_01315 [Roseateles amylovorans]
MRFASALRLFRRTSSEVHEPEPADMGTAFGMEASFGDANEYEDFRRSDYGLESQSGSRTATDSPLSWMAARRS